MGMPASFKRAAIRKKYKGWKFKTKMLYLGKIQIYGNARTGLFAIS